MDKPRNVTIFDIAEASDVSYSTVSRVLNGFEYVRDDTRRRVLQAAEELGYVANLQARSLAGGRSNIVGMLVPSLDNGYINTLSRGIYEELTKADYDLMLYTTHHERGKESKYVRAIAGGLSDGLLLMVPLLPAGQLTSTYLDVIRKQGFPYVLIDQVDPGGQSMVVDSTSWQGAFEATRYLLDLGHERIAHITGIMDINSARERLAGYRDAHEDSSVPIDSQLIVEGNFSYESGYEATLKLLERSDLPSAIFAANDVSAFGAMEAIRERDLTIPDDISILGFDDIPQASITYPKLTTVRQPLDQMGRMAVRLLLEQIETPGVKPRRVTLETELVERDSCRAPGRT